MTEEKITEVKGMLSTKQDGELKKLFYTSQGKPRRGSEHNYSKTAIIKKLDIKTDDMNTFEVEAMMYHLNLSLASIRRDAKAYGLPWVDNEPGVAGRRAVAIHGFTADLNILEDNAVKFDGIADARKRIAKQTNDIVKSQKLQIVEKKAE